MKEPEGLELEGLVDNKRGYDAVDDAPKVLGEHPDHTSYTYDEWRGERTDEKGFHWPPDDGYAERPVKFDSIDAYKKELGSVVDRIGHPKGSYLGGIPNEGSPASFEARSIDPSSLHDRYYQYEFTENKLPDGWTIETGTAAKWKQMPGGAPQLRILDENGKAVSIWRLLGGEEDGFTKIAPILQGKKDPIPFKFNKRGN